MRVSVCPGLTTHITVVCFAPVIGLVMSNRKLMQFVLQGIHSYIYTFICMIVCLSCSGLFISLWLVVCAILRTKDTFA